MTSHSSQMVSFAACGALVLLAAACVGPEAQKTAASPEAPAATGTPASSTGSEQAKGTDTTEASAPGAASTGAGDQDTAADGEAADGAAKPEGSRSPTNESLRMAIADVLDDWHDAAAVGDDSRYLDHFAPDAVFLGTDASERWDLATFTAYVKKHFKPGRGWVYTSSKRHIIVGPEENVAWFDEALERNGFDELRGTGALRRADGKWRIVHYSMTYTIPNTIAPDVEDIVKGSEL